MVDQALNAWRPAGRLGHVGLDRPSAGKSIPRIDCFSRLDVNKPDPRQQVGHEGLASGDPDVAGGGDLRPRLLDRAQVFFVRQPKIAQQGPDRTATHGHAMRHHHLGRDCGGGQIPLLADAAGDPVLQGRQFAMPAAIPLRRGRKVTGGLSLDHVVAELDRDLEPRRRRPVRIRLSHMIHNPLTQLYRMRLAHPMTPISASKERIPDQVPRES